MTRETESQLLDFCVQQHRSFSLAAWTGFDVLSAKEKATVARYLAGVSWFGQQEELSRFAASLTPEKFAELSAAINFDSSRFAGLLRMRLALQAGAAR